MIVLVDFSLYRTSDTKPLKLMDQTPDAFVFFCYFGGLTLKRHCLFPKQEGCRDTEDIRDLSQKSNTGLSLVVFQERQVILSDSKKSGYLPLPKARRNANELYALANIHTALP